jgi:hypothetical protein
MATQSDPRKAILNQMAQIQSMERGTLSEEFRERPDGAGGTVVVGPYFKHQVWEDHANHSRRVPDLEVPALRQDLANYDAFHALADSFVKVTVAQTRARRQALKSKESSESKKNFQTKRSPKNIAKQRPSSP